MMSRFSAFGPRNHAEGVCVSDGVSPSGLFAFAECRVEMTLFQSVPIRTSLSRSKPNSFASGKIPLVRYNG
ncbi:hypothetical protein [Defluviimonas sp. SAOS-178_SWC]|uniref:hypothetical protein n=1 Tax=Defluviimonas sp. SAOS-178_SWC TaxID=3121287 RepID=UPI003221C725